MLLQALDKIDIRYCTCPRRPHGTHGEGIYILQVAFFQAIRFVRERLGLWFGSSESARPRYRFGLASESRVIPHETEQKNR